MISVLDSGQLDYATGLRLQQRLVGLRKQGRIGDVLVLIEHPPVVTLGRNAKAANILASPELLARRGVEVFECDRGGDVTFHGPGQLVAYPIFDLHGFPSAGGHRRTMGVVEFVRSLEEVLIRTCAEFGIAAKRIPGLTGVWTLGQKSSAGGLSEEAKIAALGVHVASGITSHGIALNVNTDLSFFDLIIPCGIRAKPVTSMDRELARVLPLTDVAHALSRSFGTVFNSQVLWLDSLDALLGTTLGIPLKVPENLRRIRGEDESSPA
ncbi:MAG: lipoyl(octanoyl) transferase LipB [Acidobacteria bacterium]|nr:lipoyl(octanoyl) transferase LipB [Acidobacteriota bacterium]MBV9625912.1 lipoyl(octanoyl) transferase LipB [Acidobacteriota bacterium]